MTGALTQSKVDRIVMLAEQIASVSPRSAESAFRIARLAEELGPAPGSDGSSRRFTESRARARATAADSSDCTTRNCDQARQGETGHHVRYVLGVGLLGVILAFVAVITLS